MPSKDGGRPIPRFIDIAWPLFRMLSKKVFFTRFSWGLLIAVFFFAPDAAGEGWRGGGRGGRVEASGGELWGPR